MAHIQAPHTSVAARASQVPLLRSAPATKRSLDSFGKHKSFHTRQLPTAGCIGRGKRRTRTSGRTKLVWPMAGSLKIPQITNIRTFVVNVLLHFYLILDILHDWVL
jgi:hypothetical protein